MTQPVDNPVFQLLTRIAERPEMYLGGSENERAQQLHNLEQVIFGYQLALTDHALYPGRGFLMDFAAYLTEHHGCSASAGPIAAIRDMTDGADDAWARFWTLLDDYAASLR